MRLVTWSALLLALSLTPNVVFAADNPKEVPFKLYRGYAIVVHGSIGNLKNLNLLVDTGAVPSVLDVRIAKKLHLTGATEKISVFTQKVETQRAMAQDLRVGPLRADVLPVVVKDLSFAADALGTRVDAIIGFDFLSESPFTIDYEAKKITFGPIDPSLTPVHYEAHPGYALVELKIQQHSLRLLVDTGASDLVLFASAIQNCPEAIENVGTRTWSNMGGEMQVHQVQLKDAHLGALSWGTQDVFILPDGGDPPSGLSGLLGVASLKARRLAFDPEHEILAWDQNEGAARVAVSTK
jgi:predicted aspartyl protease